MLQEFQPHSPDVSLVADTLQPLSHGIQLSSGNLTHQRAGGEGPGELLLDRGIITEEGLVVLNLLVEDSCGLLVELGGNVV